MCEVVTLRGAEEEAIEIHHRYEEISPGLGLRFDQCLAADFRVLERFPRAGAAFELPFRRLLVREHSYALFYVFESRRVFIHAVLSTYLPRPAIRRRLGL